MVNEDEYEENGEGSAARLKQLMRESRQVGLLRNRKERSRGKNDRASPPVTCMCSLPRDWISLHLVLSSAGGYHSFSVIVHPVPPIKE